MQCDVTERKGSIKIRAALRREYSPAPATLRAFPTKPADRQLPLLVQHVFSSRGLSAGLTL